MPGVPPKSAATPADTRKGVTGGVSHRTSTAFATVVRASGSTARDGEQGEAQPVSKKTYVIGRAGDLRLNDETVSRRHALLEVDGDTLYLRDLDSRNGTYEIRDKQPVPFTEGPVTHAHVFAFGECVRGIGQLLKTAELEAALAGSAMRELLDGTSNPLSQTLDGSAFAPRKRLSSADIIQMLERAEDELAHGRPLDEVCLQLGIAVRRYERWCREYGATRKERERSIVALREENERLRREVAKLERRLGDTPDEDDGVTRIGNSSAG